MTDLTTARELVKDYLRGSGERIDSFSSALPGHQNRPKHELVIVKEIEYDFGWVFCWNTKRFTESGDFRHGLVGNAPLIVDRNDGRVYVTGTAHRLDYYVEEYRNGKRHPVL
jgi:hypothetical protein